MSLSKRLFSVAVVVGIIMMTAACVPASGIAVSGVVDHTDIAAHALVLDTAIGPLTATLSLSSTIQRQPIPGDINDVKMGRIALSAVQPGSNATVLLTQFQAQGFIGQLTKPANNSAEQNQETLLRRLFGLGDGYSATVSQVSIGPAPFSIEASDANPLGLQAIPASFVARGRDGNILALVTQFGYVKVVIGPATRFDRLGQPISSADPKAGDNLILYGARVWVGYVDSFYQAGSHVIFMPVTIHVAAIHLVTANEHVLAGSVAQVNPSASHLQLTADDGETFTITVAADTHYQSLVSGRSVSDLATLRRGDHVTAYTVSDSDTSPSYYNARTVYLNR